MARNERSAGFILFRRRGGAGGEAEYLLLDYGRHFDYPKGHVDPGETDLDAAVRELREETGITDARVIDGFRQELVYFFRDRKKGLVRKTVVFFAAETTSADVVLSHEHVGYVYLAFEAAVKKVSFAGARQVLRAAHEFLCAAGEVAEPCPPPPPPAAQKSPPRPPEPTLFRDASRPPSPPPEPSASGPDES